MPKIRVSNKDRVDNVMEEILQDPAKFEELLKEREQPLVKPVKTFASPLPSRQSVCLRTSERVDIADRSGDSGSKVSPPIARLVSENPLRETWIFVQGEATPRTTTVTNNEWVKWRNEDPGSFDDRYEICEEGPAIFRKRSSTLSLKTPREEVW